MGVSLEFVPFLRNRVNIAAFDLSVFENACALDWARITELNAKGISMSVGHSGTLKLMGHLGTFQIHEGWRRT
jgi:hypothetical protein